MPVITKELALEIARKLGAVKNEKKNRPHDLYVVHVGGMRIASFGIRRGSSKNSGHDFIPGQIFLSPNESKRFGECQLNYEYWIAKIREKGKLPPEPDKTA